MDQAPDPHEDHAKVASATPGRLRIRLHKPLRHHHLMRQVHEHLENQEGVRNVETNAATGSVTVSYDPRERSPRDVLAMFRDVGVIVGDVMKGMGEDVPDLGEDVPEVGHSHTSLGIVGAFDDLDRRISHATGHRIDLKLLFPLAMGAVGVRQLLRGGLGLSEVPAYIVLWYAFDAFYKLHQGHPHSPALNRRTTVVPRASHAAPVAEDGS